ncbi:MAG: radical SAM protein [Candidatus Melainabacteria bacterium]|nr:radical SAM protein [Candidatus Melainabacteria bacterium]
MNITEISSVYGPVNSWRLGKSLGIDLIMDPSTCSFNCIYCQLGSIQKITLERKLFVDTKKVLQDFKSSDWKNASVITFSGSGEPTLAFNLGEVISGIKKITNKKIIVLTNGTLLNDDKVRKDLLKANVISVKLDAQDEKNLQIINRPASGINLNLILAGIKKLKKDINHDVPILQIQTMFVSQNKNQLEGLAKLLNEIKPDEVALNTPTRPYPSGWDIITRGAHGEDALKIKYPIKPLKQLTKEEAINIENKLKELTNLKILSVYGA